jgi:glycerophosphoryl diester phosphodiesterase
MKTIAHRGGMAARMQNSPEGVRLALKRGADSVELDVLIGNDGRLCCGHGIGRRTLLGECLAELGDGMELIAHLKGRFEDVQLSRLVEEISEHVPLVRVTFAAHGGSVLGQLAGLFPEARRARFGFLPAVAALWCEPEWQCCMVNHVVLTRWHVRALQRRGLEVVASCVWEVRSRESVARLGVDGAFVNLYKGTV